MPAAAARTVVRFPSRRSVTLDDGPETIALVQEEIFRSGLTYAQISALTGRSAATVMRIAQGGTKRPAMATVASILMALGWKIIAQESTPQGTYSSSAGV